MTARLRLPAVILALAVAGATGPARALTLADDGRSDYRIAVAADAGPATRQAAEDLACYLQQATGAGFPVANADAGGPAIRLTRTRPGADGAPEDPEAFRFAVRGDDLVIAGNSDRALFYGVHRLLETHAGVHWFEPGETDVSEHQTLRVEVDEGWQAPRFGYREVFFRHADDPGFAARNRLNGRFGHRLEQPIPAAMGGDRSLRAIGIFDLVPPDEHRDANPQFFAGGQLRFADPAVRRAAKRRLRERLAEWDRAPAYLLIEHADRNTYFDGGGDAELIDRHGAASAAFVDFVRELAAVVAEGHPEVIVLAQAYLWSREPPRDMPLPDNMGVMLAGIERDFSKPLDAPVNRGFLADVDGWAQSTRHIVIWDYVTDFAGYIQPYPNIHTFAANLRVLARRDAVKGVFAQGAYGTRGAAFAELRTWLLARLLWDPQRDPDALVQEFMHGYYGPAAPYLSRYLRELTAAGERWPGKLRAKTPPTAGYLDAGFLRKADQLMDRAETAAADQPRYLRRVQTARIPVDYAVLANRARLRERSRDDWIDYERRLERLGTYLAQADATAYREGGSAGIPELLDSLAVDRGRAGAAPECRGWPESDCRIAEDLALHLVGGDAALAADESAADGAAATMPGDAKAWGIQLPLADLLPETGEWRIHVRARAETGNGDESPAVQAGVYPGGNKTFAAGPAYRTLTLPGSYSYDAERYLWLAPVRDQGVRRILIDRVIAVPAEKGS